MRDWIELGAVIGALIGVLVGFSAVKETLREDPHATNGEVIFLISAGLIISAVYGGTCGGLFAIGLWLLTLPFQALGAWLMP